MTADPVFLTLAAVLGAMLGSFLNVCIVRLPAEESVISPPSRCPGCGERIKWRDNIPIVAWLLLGGKCRHCRQPISVMYPLVELLMALLWLGAAWRFGMTWAAVHAALFGSLLLGIAMTDARSYIIPDEFSLGGLLIGLLLALAMGWDALQSALVGAVVGFGLLWLTGWAGKKAFKKEAMGGGDIKMMAMVGAFLGWEDVLLTIFLGALLGTVVFVPISLKTGKLVPFGVFLAAGAAVTFLYGDTLVGWYVRYLVT